MNRNSFFRGAAFPGILAAFIAFAVYLATMAPSVSWEDGGEIATSLYTLGIVHPTGYPLFTLLGWAFSHLPLGGRVIWQLNLLMAILTALSVFFFYRIFLFLLIESRRKIRAVSAVPVSASVRKGKGRSGSVASVTVVTDEFSWRDTVAAAGAALALSFSRTFWSEALTVEVHSFQLLLLSGVVYLFLRAVSERAAASGDRLWMLFALILGLSFSNHMMTVLLAPAFLYLYFQAHGFRSSAFLKISKAIPVFLLGLSPYLYLPLRGAQKPFMNWGDPTTPGRFLEHVSGQQYRYRMFSSWDVPVTKAQGFFLNLPTEFGYAPLILTCIGLWALYRQNRRLWIFCALLFSGCVLYGINYDFDDPNYFLIAYIAVAALMVFGLRSAMQRTGGVFLTLLLALVVLLFPLGLNYSEANKQGDYAAEDFARNTLNALDSGTVFLSQDEVFFLFPAHYLQSVEKFRTDVVVLNQPLLQHPWYLRSMRKAHPEIFAASDPEIAAFLRADSLVVHYHGPDPDPRLEEYQSGFFRAFQELIESLLWKNYPKHPIAVSQGTELSPTAKAAPQGLAFRLFAPQDSIPAMPPPLDFVIRPFVGEDRHLKDVQLEYCRAYTNQGIYRVVFVGDTVGGIRLLQKAVQLEPGFPAAVQWLFQLRQLQQLQ